MDATTALKTEGTMDMSTSDRRISHRFSRTFRLSGRSDGGQCLGRATAISDAQIRQARALLNRLDESVSSIARRLGFRGPSLYKYVPVIWVG
jgi:AraC-like DNA-binding protein